MDQETLANHIAGLGKSYFENACRIVLTDVFDFLVINVDGKGDGGTDYTSFASDGNRRKAAYQITTQKSDVQRKAYKDAKKALEKLQVNKFYFLSSYYLNQVEIIKIEHEISNELDVQCTCLSSNQIAGLILSEGLLNRFLDESNYPLPRDFTPTYDYREMALHSYTLLSNDAGDMKDGIYDDTLLYVLSESKPLIDKELIEKALRFLGLGEIKEDIFKRRISSLFGKNRIARNGEGKIILSKIAQTDVESRKRIYEIELSSLVSAQVDLLRDDFGYDWTIDDSKKVAIWIAEAYIIDRISSLKEAKISIISNSLFQLNDGSVEKIEDYLRTEKKIAKDKIGTITEALLKIASNHPLINKLTRASIYLAVEGTTPNSSAKAFGANRWSDFNFLIEPSVGIPYICSRLYDGYVNRQFDMAVKSIKRVRELDGRLCIPYSYVNECAGHLLQARKYLGVEMNDEELQYSNNAFVANYYALKTKGKKLPADFMEYLCTFSAAVRTPRSNVKEWVRSLMTDIQSILNKAGIEFLQTPFYSFEDYAFFFGEYSDEMEKIHKKKPVHLINHDAMALQYTNEEITQNNAHWIILTFDRALIGVSQTQEYQGWISSPMKFLDTTEITKPLSDSNLVSLVHSVATYSESTLSIGARIIDRVVRYASDEMQKWEFKQEIDLFKKETIQNFKTTTFESLDEVDRRTDEFLESKGLKLHFSEENDMDDIEG